MSDIWTPSDELLAKDPIATSKILHPFPSPDLAEAGIVLPDSDAEANEELADIALAELDGDEPEGEVESGAVDDDHAIDDPDDVEPIGDEV